MSVIYQIVISKTISFYYTFPNVFHNFFHHEQYFQTSNAISLKEIIILQQRTKISPRSFPSDIILVVGIENDTVS